jgi:RNA polymerase sigma factor (sigma-70 family)
MALRIARGMCKRLPQSVLREDVEQAALIGLWDGLRKCPDPNTPGHEWYLRRRISGQIIDELRAQDWLPRRTRGSQGEGAPVIVRFDDLGNPGDGHFYWEDRLPGVEWDPISDIDMKAQVAEAWRAPLIPADRHVIEQHTMRGVKMKTIGDSLGVSEPAISQRHTRGLRVMRAYLTGDVDEANQDCHPCNQIPSRTRRIIEETHEHRKHQRSDRAAVSAQSGHRRAAPYAEPIRAGGMGAAPARRPDRPVPPRGIALVAAAPRATVCPRPAEATAHDSGAWLVVTPRADFDWGDLPMSAALNVVAPSTLPEEGLNLPAELDRYRQWMIEQALFRSAGNKAEAARLLGLNRTTLVEMLKRDNDPSRPALEEQAAPVDSKPLLERMDAIIVDTLASVGGNHSRAADLLGIGRTTLYRRLAKRAERASGGTTDAPALARQESPSMIHEAPTIIPPPPDPPPPPSEPPSAVHQRQVDPYAATRAEALRLKGAGLTRDQIARRLGKNRFLIEKLIREPVLAKCGGRG